MILSLCTFVLQGFKISKKKIGFHTGSRLILNREHFFFVINGSTSKEEIVYAQVNNIFLIWRNIIELFPFDHYNCLTGEEQISK